MVRVWKAPGCWVTVKSLVPGFGKISGKILPVNDEISVLHGSGFTVIATVLLQPAGNVYVIVAAPAVMPVTTPEDEPIVATVTGVELQVPPVMVSVNTAVFPTQIFNGPVIKEGSGLTVTTAFTLQPIAYVIVSVPAAIPVTMPDDEPIVPIAGELLLQVPPEVASVKVVAAPAHMVIVPKIGDGAGYTVSIAEAVPISVVA